MYKEKKEKSGIFFFYLHGCVGRRMQSWEGQRREEKVKQKDAVKNSGPVTSTGPSKDHGPLYYFSFPHRLHRMPRNARNWGGNNDNVSRAIAPTIHICRKLEKFMRISTLNVLLL